MYTSTAIRPPTAQTSRQEKPVTQNYSGGVVDPRAMSEAEKSACRRSMEKLVAISPTFKGMDSDLICNAISNWEILLRKIPAEKIIIHEWDGNCNSFFILVHGTLVVSKELHVITELGNIGSFGTMGYMQDSVRNSTVTSKTNAVILEIRRDFADKLPAKEQIALYRNIAAETSAFIAQGNEKLRDATLKRKLDLVQQRISALGV